MTKKFAFFDNHYAKRLKKFAHLFEHSLFYIPTMDIPNLAYTPVLISAGTFFYGVEPIELKFLKIFS